MVMEYKVKFLPGADDNLTDIDANLSQFYPNTPAKFFEKLDKQLLLLQEQPYMGAVYLPNPKYRRIAVDKYLVFYVVNEDKREIEIYRVLRVSWDISEHIG